MSRTDPASWLAQRAGKTDVGPDHATAKEFGRLLRLASERFQEEPRMIANRVAQLETMLASNGMNENAKSLLEGFIDAAPKGRRSGFGEMCQHYYNLRLKGYAPKEALDALRRAGNAGTTP